MGTVRILKALLIIPLIGILGIFFFFYRMGQNDAKALADFPVVYAKFDRAISDFSKPVLESSPGAALTTGDLEGKADEALVELNTKASVRISSLTKNDGDLMRIANEIADLSGKELNALKAYQSAAANGNVGLEELAKELLELTNSRKTAYARYQELSGLEN